MSQALDYLVKARPDAVGAYFKFLKESGKHLDTKTRDLISVITKVDAQTENGLRQYLARALRNGASPDEVIDALLMAFPTLGLAKIVWATNIILDMNIPGFAPEQLGQDKGWHDLCEVSDLPDKQATRVESDGRGVFVYRDGDDVQVFDAMCPHQVNNIPELAIDGTELTCPKHNWKFDIRTGECIEKGNRAMNPLESKIEDGMLLAYW